MLRRALFATLLLMPAGAFAEPQYMLDYALPRGGTRGATVLVMLHGRSLDQPKEILFYGGGIRATQIAPAPGKPGEQIQARFEIAADAPLGEHVFRVRTAQGLSDAMTFWVSRYPTVYETEKKQGDNDTLAKAQAIPLNCTVEGQINAGPAPDTDIYWSRFNAGERISVEVESIRLGTLHLGGENDLAVRILDENGKELGRNDDSALYVQDPVLSVVAPRAGSYFIEIRQQVFYRPNQAWYRAHIGNFSRPLAVFPAGGQAGTTISARILGDPTGEREELITLPRAAGDFAYFSGGAPSANTLRVSPYPNAAPDSVAVLPAAFNGILSKPGQEDTFHFQAKKGEAWKFRVYGRTLGSPVDPKIWIADARTGKHLVNADDSKLQDLGLPSARGTWYIKDQMDPIAIFKPGADGEYVLGVADTRGSSGPTFVYRVEAEAVKDTILTHITMNDGYQIPRLTGLIVPQGNRWTLDVQLSQGLGNAYKGPLRLEAMGLPKGVSMVAPEIAPGVNRIPVQFVATPNAEQQAVLIELRARPVDPKFPLESGSRQGFALINRGGEMPLHFVWLNKYALAVTQPAPFSLELEAPGAALSQSGEVELKVKVHRLPDFKGAVEIQPDWLPPNVSKEGTVTIAADKDEGVFHIQANAKAAAGTYKIAMNASTTGGDAYSGVGRVRVSSAFVDLKVSEPLISIDLKHSSVERGQAGIIVGALHPGKGFTGTATATLKRLPKGVALSGAPPQIHPQDSEIRFPIKADADALAGLYKDIICEVTVKEDGQTIHQQTGSGILRIDPARSVGAAVSGAK